MDLINYDSYTDQALLTLSNSFHVHRIEDAEVKQVLENFIKSAEQLDKIKKTWFYGREYTPILSPDQQTSDVTMTIGMHPDIIHSIIGMATEAAELVEILYGCLFLGEVFDAIHFGEEVGDHNWYQAIGLHRAKLELGRILVANINKLRARFPENFTEYDANHRALDNERATLESSL